MEHRQLLKGRREHYVQITPSAQGVCYEQVLPTCIFISLRQHDFLNCIRAGFCFYLPKFAHAVEPGCGTESIPRGTHANRIVQLDKGRDT